MYHRIALPVNPMNPWLPSAGLVKALTGQNRAILRAIAVLEPFDLELHFGRPRREIAPRPTVVEARRRLKSLILDAELSEVIIETTAIEGSWLGSILDEIRKNSCDLLLVGGIGGEPPERLEELVPDLMLHAPVPVCSARGSGWRDPVRRIVVATDLSENA